jgi:GT2 family glycosyltransferase
VSDPTSQNTPVRITAVLTCHNRKQATLACLQRLFAQELPPGHQLDAVLVDDGSRDGTGEAVRQGFPQVNVLQGDGNLYWCGGMRVAWNAAAQQDPDYYLLLNDDTLLLEKALLELLGICGSPDNRILAIASIQDPETGTASYGGVKRPGGLAAPNGQLQDCQTFNANCVLLPRKVYQELGIFHHAYTHGMGDTDYGLQANRKAIRILSSARFLGTCQLNVGRDVWRDRSLPRLQRLKALQSPKGLPFREWMEFNRRNSGWKWPYPTISPFLRILLGR